MAAGHDEEPSVSAEAGGILDAETAIEIHGLHVMVASYIEALNAAAEK